MVTIRWIDRTIVWRSHGPFSIVVIMVGRCALCIAETICLCWNSSVDFSRSDESWDEVNVWVVTSKAQIPAGCCSGFLRLNVAHPVMAWWRWFSEKDMILWVRADLLALASEGIYRANYLANTGRPLPSRINRRWWDILGPKGEMMLIQLGISTDVASLWWFEIVNNSAIFTIYDDSIGAVIQFNAPVRDVSIDESWWLVFSL